MSINNNPCGLIVKELHQQVHFGFGNGCVGEQCW